MRDSEFYREKGYRDAVEYYREIKWEDTGYLSPELSTQDTYPDYIREEAQISAYDVNKHLDGDNTITFGFMTDLHYATTENHRIRMKRMLNAYKDMLIYQNTMTGEKKNIIVLISMRKIMSEC